ncbi:hypothetical protein N7461_007156 [Penicillium sp. DV-2018c]|nr:hypothetical protein N7461_007156 [Penicillium sp. DV-2018c]
MMFQIISDLHLESPAAYDVFEVNPKAPYLALLGDIGYVKDEGLFHFLPYHSSWSETKSAVNKFKTRIDDTRGSSETLGKLVILDQTRYDISPGITVLGCTLFSRVAQAQKECVNFGLNDFYYIDDWTIEAHQDAHHADLV